jgi:hypothetical protein
MGRFYSRRQLSAINWKRKLKKRWDAEPEVMEAIRVKATTLAAKMRHDQMLGLHDLIAQWPAVLDTSCLDKHIREVIPEGYQPSSLIRRLKRLGLIRYRNECKEWHNLCHLPRRQDP